MFKINPDIGLHGLSTVEIQEIFEGRVTNWAQVGGPNLAISIVLPPAAANINEIFHSFVSSNIVENANAVRINTDSPLLVTQSVVQTPGSISYVPLAVAQKSGTTILSIDGVAPSTHSLLDGTYQFWSMEHLYTKGRRSITVQAYEGFLSDNQEEHVLSEFDVVPIHLIDQQVINSHSSGPEV